MDNIIKLADWKRQQRDANQRLLGELKWQQETKRRLEIMDALRAADKNRRKHEDAATLGESDHE